MPETLVWEQCQEEWQGVGKQEENQGTLVCSWDDFEHP